MLEKWKGVVCAPIAKKQPSSRGHMFQKCAPVPCAYGVLNFCHYVDPFVFLLLPSPFGMEENTSANESSFGKGFMEGCITITPS